MDAHILERQFERMGGRAKVVRAKGRNVRSDVSIDIGRDAGGEFFEIALGSQAEPDLRVIDVRPDIRHLLLMTQQEDGKHKFLCGHDERHWFVAAVPERATVSNVITAFDALKPRDVHIREHQLKVKPKKRNRRKNDAFVRQGEWFFVPVPSWQKIDERWILRNEPINRGGGKPHMCEELVRQGGESVYVSRHHPNGLTEQQYERLLSKKPKLKKLSWMRQIRNPGVFVRGKVRHADHKTILLDGWHQVIMNTETQSVAMRHVAFID